MAQPVLYDLSSSVGDFLKASAGRTPIPGGGSITALVGALSCAMGEMCINYSIGRKGSEAFEVELKPALQEINRARTLLAQLMVEDQAAYDAMSRARQAPATDPDRQARFNASLVACIRIPQAIAATAVSVLELVDRITGFINPYLLSDLAVSADLAMATVRCAVYSVRANLADVKDPTDRASIENTIRGLLTRGAALIQRVSPRIWERHGLEV